MNKSSNENLFCVCAEQVFTMQLLALWWIYQRLAVAMWAAYCKIATGIHPLPALAKVRLSDCVCVRRVTNNDMDATVTGSLSQGGSATLLCMMTDVQNESNVTELRVEIATCISRSNFGIRRAMYVAVAHKQTQVYMKVNGPKIEQG